MKRAGVLRRLAQRVHVEPGGTLVAGRWSATPAFALRTWGLGGYVVVGTREDDVDRGLVLAVGPAWLSIERYVRGDDDLNAPEWWAA